jgi:hypothetical protein
MIALNIADLKVDSFPTSDTGTGSIDFTAEEFGGTLEPQVLFAPITAHTDPCDVCCQQQ